MLPVKLIENFASWVNASLTANADDLEAEAMASETGQATANFTLVIRRIVGDKWKATARSRFPREATVETAVFDFQLQQKLPGVG